MSKCKKYGNRLPPLLNGDSEKKLFCNWWNICLHLLVAIYLWITIFHLLVCLPILQWKTFEQVVCSTKIGYTNTLLLGTNNSKKKLSGGFEYHTSSKRNSSAFTVVGWNGNRVHKQPPRDVPSKRRSKNMQQICRRTPMPKCSFNKVALQLYWNRTSAWVFSCKFAAYFQNTFS